MLSRLLPIAVVAALACALAPAASAQSGGRLWATVNVCDSAKQPDTVGVRASMPGLGTVTTTLYMRFRVQYLSPTADGWRFVRRGGDSGLLRVGRARVRSMEAGHSFRVAPSATVLLRGVVTFEWRRGGEVVRRARRTTTAGHRSTTGADPEGFSAATCRLRP
jgi:hypothetical protein